MSQSRDGKKTGSAITPNVVAPSLTLAQRIAILQQQQPAQQKASEISTFSGNKPVSKPTGARVEYHQILNDITRKTQQIDKAAEDKKKKRVSLERMKQRRVVEANKARIFDDEEAPVKPRIYTAATVAKGPAVSAGPRRPSLVEKNKELFESESENDSKKFSRKASVVTESPMAESPLTSFLPRSYTNAPSTSDGEGKKLKNDWVLKKNKTFNEPPDSESTRKKSLTAETAAAKSSAISTSNDIPTTLEQKRQMILQKLMPNPSPITKAKPKEKPTVEISASNVSATRELMLKMEAKLNAEKVQLHAMEQMLEDRKKAVITRKEQEAAQILAISQALPPPRSPSLPELIEPLDDPALIQSLEEEVKARIHAKAKENQPEIPKVTFYRQHLEQEIKEQVEKLEKERQQHHHHEQTPSKDSFPVLSVEALPEQPTSTPPAQQKTFDFNSLSTEVIAVSEIKHQLENKHEEIQKRRSILQEMERTRKRASTIRSLLIPPDLLTEFLQKEAEEEKELKSLEKELDLADLELKQEMEVVLQVEENLKHDVHSNILDDYQDPPPPSTSMVPEVVPDVVSNVLPDVVSETLPEDSPKAASEDVSGYTPKVVPKDTSEVLSENVSQDAPDEASREIPEDENKPKDAPEDDDKPKDAPDDDDKPKDAPEDDDKHEENIMASTIELVSIIPLSSPDIKESKLEPDEKSPILPIVSISLDEAAVDKADSPPQIPEIVLADETKQEQTIDPVEPISELITELDNNNRISVVAPIEEEKIDEPKSTEEVENLEDKVEVAQQQQQEVVVVPLPEKESPIFQQLSKFPLPEGMEFSPEVPESNVGQAQVTQVGVIDKYYNAGDVTIQQIAPPTSPADTPLMANKSQIFEEDNVLVENTEENDKILPQDLTSTELKVHTDVEVLANVEKEEAEPVSLSNISKQENTVESLMEVSSITALSKDNGEKVEEKTEHDDDSPFTPTYSVLDDYTDISKDVTSPNDSPKPSSSNTSPVEPSLYPRRSSSLRKKRMKSINSIATLLENTPEDTITALPRRNSSLFRSDSSGSRRKVLSITHSDLAPQLIEDSASAIFDDIFKPDLSSDSPEAVGRFNPTRSFIDVINEAEARQVDSDDSDSCSDGKTNASMLKRLSRLPMKNEPSTKKSNLPYKGASLVIPDPERRITRTSFLEEILDSSELKDDKFNFLRPTRDDEVQRPKTANSSIGVKEKEEENRESPQHIDDAINTLMYQKELLERERNELFRQFEDIACSPSPDLSLLRKLEERSRMLDHRLSIANSRLMMLERQRNDQSVISSANEDVRIKKIRRTARVDSLLRTSSLAPLNVSNLPKREGSLPTDSSTKVPYRPPSFVGIDPDPLSSDEARNRVIRQPAEFARARAVVARFDAHAAVTAAAAAGGRKLPVFSDQIDKLGRNGRWQRRDFRFDGSHIVCLRPEKVVVPPNSLRIIQNGVDANIQGFYNTKPPLPKVNHPLLATSDTTGLWVNYYQAPKWVIPVQDIISVEMADGSTPGGFARNSGLLGLSRFVASFSEDPCRFLVRTKIRDYVMRAKNENNLACWLFLLRRMVDAAHEEEEEEGGEMILLDTSVSPPARIVLTPEPPSATLPTSTNVDAAKSQSSLNVSTSEEKMKLWRTSLVELCGFDPEAGQRVKVGSLGLMEEIQVYFQEK